MRDFPRVLFLNYSNDVNRKRYIYTFVYLFMRIVLNRIISRFSGFPLKNLAIPCTIILHECFYLFMKEIRKKIHFNKPYNKLRDLTGNKTEYHGWTFF